MSCLRQYEVESSAEMLPYTKYSVNAACGRDVYGVAVGNGIELRIPVDITLTQNVQRKVTTLSGLSYDETAPFDTSKLPSIVVYRMKNGDTLWKLSKKHCSTSKLISVPTA
jgi:LysM repeat protein